MTDLERRDVLRGVASAAAAPFFASSVAGQSTDIQGPNGVHVAYGRDPASTLRIGWSGGPAADAHIEIGSGGEDRTVVTADARPLPGRTAIAYTATVTGLAPDTTYEYEAVLDDRRAGPFAVDTATEDGEGFTVTGVGDHGVDDPENVFQRPSTDDPERVMAAAASLDPDLQLLTGDISYSNGQPSTWEVYFDTHEAFYAETPFMTAPGNHEAEVGTGLTQYDRRLNDIMPIHDPIGLEDLEHRQRWYHLDYDNTRFVSLTTTTDGCGDVSRAEEFFPIVDPTCRAGGATYDDVQERYVRQVLQDAVADDDITWKVVYFHGPFWTDSPDHAPRDVLRDRWGTVFDEYGVDLVLCGDNHVWERTKPIAAKPGRDDYAPADAWDWESDVGTTFVTNGTGGTSHYGFGNTTPSDFLTRRTNTHFGVERLDIDDDRIRVEYHTIPDDEDADADTVVADAFEIRKSDDRTAAGARRPTQVDLYDGPVDDSLVVAGTRTDDGQLFTGGQTNRIDIEWDANRPVTIRDRIPSTWDVVGGDAARTDDSAPGDTTWVFLDADPAESGTVTYFVEVPEDPTQTGQHTIGPFQARSTRREEWMTVPGTSSDETVIGLGA